jgi:hypothetical protein
MATTRRQIDQLFGRIDAVVRRQHGGPLSLNDITEEAWLKIDRRVQELSAALPEGPERVSRTDYDRWTDDDLIRMLLADGVLTAGDLKPRL